MNEAWNGAMPESVQAKAEFQARTRLHLGAGNLSPALPHC